MMNLRFAGIALLTGVAFISVALRATPGRSPGDCPRDSKLLNDGPTAVFGEGPGTWWGLIVDGMNAAGLDTEAEQIAYLNGVFGVDFDNLDDLKDLNLQSVSTLFDKNHNDYVCAFDNRGTRTYRHDPYASFTYYGIADDKIRK